MGTIRIVPWTVAAGCYFCLTAISSHSFLPCSASPSCHQPLVHVPVGLVPLQGPYRTVVRQRFQSHTIGVQTLASPTAGVTLAKFLSFSSADSQCSPLHKPASLVVRVGPWDELAKEMGAVGCVTQTKVVKSL